MPVIVEGLDELLQRLSAYPQKVKKALKTTMDYSLLSIAEAVPPYPAAPSTSTYVRTGTLGRTLTVGGESNIYEVHDNGDYLEGEFGTNLEYAPFVIGDPESEQAAHMSYWWTLPVTVLNKALGKIQEGWQALADELADYLAGKGE